MRVVNMTVTGDLVEVDSSVVGVQGSGNADTMRITFDAAWDSWAKTAVWWDAHGNEAASRTLTADLLEDMAVSVRRYLLPVPPEALRYGGPCTLVVDGYRDGKRGRTVTQTFDVARAPMRTAVGGAVTTPTDMEQMQGQVDNLLGQFQTVLSGEAGRVAAEAERVEAETARESAEEDRAESEEDRKRNEAARLDDERDRAHAETDRVKSEIARESAEGDRIGGEQIREANESERKRFETLRRNAEKERQKAEEARQGAVGAQVEAATQAAKAAQAAAAISETVQAALALTACLKAGPEEDAEELAEDRWLLVTDDAPVTWEALVAEAEKARQGLENDLTAMAVLSAVNGTNWRRDTEGAHWTTDTLDDFTQKLITFCGTAVEAGYAVDGRIVVTWSQVQHWLLTEEMVTPLDAEAMTWPWTPVREEAATWRTEVMERLGDLEAQFYSFAERVMAAVEGAEP